MKKLITLLSFLVSLSVFSQADSSALDKMSPEELLKYYQNEKPPFSNYRGPGAKVGDSLYKNLNTQVVPTETVNGPSIFRFSEEPNQGRIKLFDSVDRAQQKMKPKIEVGMGRLGFFGDLYSKHFQSPLTARMAYDMRVSVRLTRYLQYSFGWLFGTLGANENLTNRHENFWSEIRGINAANIMYDFGNFIPDDYNVRPYLSFGVTFFNFLSKTDLKDKNGNTYYYWSDGSIKDKAETAPDAQFAKDLKRDYTYETDVRERNADGFGKYNEYAFAFPVGAGFVAKVTDRIDARMNFQMFFTTTDYIDGVSNKSIGNRAGNKQKDKFSYTSFSIQYDLVALPREKKKLAQDTLNGKFWLAMDNEDSDKDKVPDLKDDCQGTPEGAAVDDKGCPLDDDKDGIPNFRDDELSTPKGMPVNEKGVGQGDDYWKEWYAQYMNDTIGDGVEIEYVGSPSMLATKGMGLGKEKKELYTVELARYNGAIPSDELALLLSIGDIKSLTMEDGTTVVYVSGEYKKVKTAVKRRDEFRAEGNKGAKVSKIKGKNIIPISEDELAMLIKKQEEEDMKQGTAGTNTTAVNSGTAAGTNTAVASNTTAVGSNTASAIEKDEHYNKGDIVYRVQLGAFKNKISTSVFNTSAGVLELKTGESFRYVTRGFKTIEEAASVRADLVIQGYSDAFVTAYRDGKRIPMNQTQATITDKTFKEDLNENKTFSTVDKKLVVYKVQLGPLKKSFQEKGMDDRISSATIKDVEKQTTATGSIRYVTGSFKSQEEADKFVKQMVDKGFGDAFTIATFKGDIISLQEAAELLKK